MNTPRIRAKKWPPFGQRRIRTAHLLPSVFTSGNVACGTAAILKACDGQYETAGWLILAGFLFDVLDGRVAKLLHASSNFGVQLDSLADVITFGVAPAVLFRSMLYAPDSRLGFSLAILYGTCTALRLARYNVTALKSGPSDARSSFLGLPCPCAAALLASLAIVLHEFDIAAAKLPQKIGIHLLIFGLSVLMVSRVRFPDLIARRVERGSVFNYLVIGAILLSIGVIEPPLMVLVASASFIVGGPFVAAMDTRRRRTEDAEPPTVDEEAVDLEPVNEEPVSHGEDQ